MIHLISTFEPIRTVFLTQFVEHYATLGVEKFHLSLQIEPDVSPEEAAKHAAVADATLSRLGLSLAATLVKPFNSRNLREHHDRLTSERCSPDDWVVWADIDELQVYPGDCKSLLKFGESIGLDYFRGYFVDRASADGKLHPFDPARSLWSQYPRMFTPPGIAPGTKTWKVTCSRPHVPISPGNHYPVGQKSYKYYAEPVEIHHFKWDDTVVQRLSRRLLPDFRDTCGWWTESRDLLDYIARTGRITGTE